MALPLSVAITALDRISAPLGRIQSRLGRFGADVKQVGRNLTAGLTLPILALGTATITTAAGFQSEMNNVRVLTGAVGEDFDALKMKAKELGSTTQFSARQAAAGQALLGKAGLDARQILASLPAVLNLSAAGELSIAQGADIAATSMKAFRFEADQVDRVSNSLTTGFTAVNTTIDGLFAGLSKVGPVARGLGFDFEETVATIALMQDAGAKAELAGTGLRGVFAKIIQGAPEFRRAADALKLRREDFFDGNNQLRSMAEILEALERVGADSGDVIRLFGTEAGPAFAGLLGQGSEALKELTQRMKTDTTSASRVAAARMEGAAGATLELKSSFEGLLIAVGESGLLEAFTDFVKQLTGFVQKMGQADPKTLKVATALLAVVAAIGPALVGFGALITSITGMVSAIGIFGPALTGLATTLFTVVIPAIVSFTVALATNPVFLIITAIAALIGVVIFLATHWEETVAAWKFGWNVVKLKAFEVIDAVKSKIRSLTDAIPDEVKELLGFVPGFGGALRAAESFAQTPTTIGGQTRLQTAFGAFGSGRNLLRVVFENTPPGVNVDGSQTGEEVELETGFAMAGV